MPKLVRSFRSVTQTIVTRTTPFKDLPTYIAAQDVAAFLAIPLAEAENLIQDLPHKRFGGVCCISKHQLTPDAPLACAARAAIRQMLRDKTFPHRALLLKEVQKFMKAHGR